MANEKRELLLQELLDRWEERREEGKPPSAEELCRDHPELLAEVRQQIAALLAMEQFLGGSPEATAAPPADEPRVGRYWPLRFHARGGMGEILIARDQELQREVALKRLQLPFARNDDARRRLLLEAEITGRLEHPGIVPVYGLVQDKQGQPCYAMRLIRGHTLREEIEQFHGDGGGRTSGERLLGLQKLLRIFLTVCDTVAYAHSRGVIHRDLKPGNIMVDKYGGTLVVDWGMAKPGTGTDGGADLEESFLMPPAMRELEPSQPGSAKGTLGYMSPEQAAGRWQEVGPASDIYSLGATLYCLLTGRPPCQVPDLATDAAAQRYRAIRQTLEQIRQGEFPRPRKLDPRVPPALEAICLKAMQLQPQQRYATARELAADIEQWLADEPVRAWREPWTVKLRRWLKRHRLAVSSAAAALLMALVGLSGLAAVLSRKNQELAEANQQLDAANAQVVAERDNVRLQRDQAEEHLYLAHVNLAWNALADRNLSGARELLATHLPEPGRPDRRGAEWYLLWPLLHRDRLTIDELWPVDLSFSPSGKVLAIASPEAIVLCDAVSGGLIRTLPVRATSIAFATEAILAAAAGPEIQFWDVPQGEKLRAIRTEGQEVRLLAASSDGKVVAAGGWDRVVRIYDVQTGEEQQTLVGHSNPVGALAFSADGKILASGDAGGGLEESRSVILWDVETGEQRGYFPLGNRGAHALAFTSDGQLLAAALHRFEAGEVVFWRPDSVNEIVQTIGGPDSRFRQLIFSPDDSFLIARGGDGIALWGRSSWPASSGMPRYAEVAILRLHQGQVLSLALSRDGTFASSGREHTVRLWDIERERHPARFQQHPHPFPVYYYGSFSADGAALALMDNSGTLYVSGEEQMPAQLQRELRDFERPPAVDFGGLAWPLPPLPVNYDALAIAADGTKVAVANSRMSGKIWVDVRSTRGGLGRAEASLEGHMSTIGTLAFAPDGKMLASGSWDTTVRLWNLAVAPIQSEVLRGHQGAVTALAFSRDGGLLASAESTEEYPERWSYSKDGPLLSQRAGRGEVILWDVRRRQLLARLPGPVGDVRVIAWGPDGKTLVVGEAGGTVRVFDVPERKLLYRRSAHAKGVTALACSPDGRTFVSGAADGMVTLWSIDTGQQLAILHRFASGVAALAARDDGSFFAASRDGLIRCWHPASETEVYDWYRRAAQQPPYSPAARVALARSCWAMYLLHRDTKPAEARHFLRQTLAVLRRLELVGELQEHEKSWFAELGDALKRTPPIGRHHISGSQPSRAW